MCFNLFSWHTFYSGNVLSAKQKQEYGGINRQLNNYLERIAISEAKMDRELLTYILQIMVLYEGLCFRLVRLCTIKGLHRKSIKCVFFNSVHDKFHRTLILSGFCFLKIAKISLNSSFFPKPIKR